MARSEVPRGTVAVCFLRLQPLCKMVVAMVSLVLPNSPPSCRGLGGHTLVTFACMMPHSMGVLVWCVCEWGGGVVAHPHVQVTITSWVVVNRSFCASQIRIPERSYPHHMTAEPSSSPVLPSPGECSITTTLWCMLVSPCSWWGSLQAHAHFPWCT